MTPISDASGTWLNLSAECGVPYFLSLKDGPALRDALQKRFRLPDVDLGENATLALLREMYALERWALEHRIIPLRLQDRIREVEGRL